MKQIPFLKDTNTWKWPYENIFCSWCALRSARMLSSPFIQLCIKFAPNRQIFLFLQLSGNIFETTDMPNFVGLQCLELKHFWRIWKRFVRCLERVFWYHRGHNSHQWYLHAWATTNRFWAQCTFIRSRAVPRSLQMSSVFFFQKWDSVWGKLREISEFKRISCGWNQWHG